LKPFPAVLTHLRFMQNSFGGLMGEPRI